MFLGGESHIDFCTQCVIITLAGGAEIIVNDALKIKIFFEFQSLFPANGHLCR